jgi:uncharacterized membrane protein YagU involved in acid resistance
MVATPYREGEEHMSATVSHSQVAPAETTLAHRLTAGILGGVAGGIVFGIMMAAMGMLPMVAMLVGSESAIVGLGVHLLISIAIGISLTLTLGPRLMTTPLLGLAVGAAYGGLWWVLGPLLIMPAMMGMPLFTIDTAALWSLLGHAVYGAILGIVAAAVIKTRRA